jgi:mRNA interferase MazF
MKRGEIWLADLNPRRGTEPGKTRPVLIVQSQALLDAGHPSTLIVPLTTHLTDDAEPLRIRVEPRGTLRRRSDLLIDQLRAIDNARLIKGPLTALDVTGTAHVDEALRQVLDLVRSVGDADALGPDEPEHGGR